jgi:ribosomal protein L37AE/L43A
MVGKDISLCPKCKSDKGFRIDKGKVICKVCGYEDRCNNKPYTIGDIFMSHPMAQRLMRNN